MASQNIDLYIKTNISDVLAGLKEVSKVTKTLKGDFFQYEKQIERFNSTSVRSKKSINDLSEATNKNSKDVEKNKSAINKTMVAWDKMKTYVNNAKNAIVSAFSYFTPLSLGVGFSLAPALSSAHELNRSFVTLRNELASLSDKFGDAGGAISMMYEAAAGSLAARGTIKNALLSLSDAGITAKESLVDLAKEAGNLQMSTGIAATEWNTLQGALSFKYGMTVKEINGITSSLVGLGLQGNQLKGAMQSLNKAIENIASSSNISSKNIKAFSQTFGAAIGTLNKFGIQSEKSGEFFNKLLDPRKVSENAFLLGKLGMSVGDVYKAFGSKEGPQSIIDMAVKRLPQVANEIQNLMRTNVPAALNLADQLGIDMEIVRNMGDKSAAEIEEVLAQQLKAAKDEEAAKKKRKKAAEEEAKINDRLTDLKIKALKPLMNFLNNNQNKIFEIFRKITTLLAAWFKLLVPPLEKILDYSIKATNIISGWLSKFEKEYNEIFNAENIGDAIKKAFVLAGSVLKDIFIKAGEKWLNIFSQLGPFGKTLMAAGTAFLGYKVVTGTFKKGIDLLTGRAGSKKSSEATVDELAEAIGKSVGKEVSGSTLFGSAKNMVGDFFKSAATKTALLAVGGYFLTKGLFKKLGASEGTSTAVGVVGGVGGTALGIKSATGFVKGIKIFAADTLKAAKEGKPIMEVAKTAAKNYFNHVSWLGRSANALKKASENLPNIINRTSKIFKAIPGSKILTSIGEGAIKLGKLALKPLEALGKMGLRAVPIVGAAVTTAIEASFAENDDELAAAIAGGIGGAIGGTAGAAGGPIGAMFGAVTGDILGRHLLTPIVKDALPAFRKLGKGLHDIGKSFSSAYDKTSKFLEVQKKFEENRIKAKYDLESENSLDELKKTGNIFSFLGSQISIGIGRLGAKIKSAFGSIFEGIGAMIDNFIIDFSKTGAGKYIPDFILNPVKQSVNIRDSIAKRMKSIDSAIGETDLEARKAAISKQIKEITGNKEWYQKSDRESKMNQFLEYLQENLALTNQQIALQIKNNKSSESNEENTGGLLDFHKEKERKDAAAAAKIKANVDSLDRNLVIYSAYLGLTTIS